MAVDDSYTKALLHFDGADASTTFTDESGKSWTAASNAQIDTAQSVFGGASGLFDGTDDYISTADSADWNLDDGSNANKWTIDCRVRFAAVNRSHMICEQYVNVNSYWQFLVFYNPGVDTRVMFQLVAGGVVVVQIQYIWTPSANVWYHLALVKDGTNGYAIFIDGTKVTGWDTATDTIGDLAGALTIGGSTNFTPYWMAGWIDEFRLSKGVARWTADFTPQTIPYCAGGQVIIWSS